MLKLARLFLTLLLLVGAISLDAQVRFRPRIAQPGVAIPPITPSSPSIQITAPDGMTGCPSACAFTTAGTTIATVAGIAADDIAVTNVTWACSTCSPTSGTASSGNGAFGGLSETWSLGSVGLAVGANTITITAHDAVPLTTAVSIVVTRAADTTAPTITITTNGGVDFSTTGTTTTIVGTAADNTAVTSVTWECTTTVCTPDSGTATGTTSWTTPTITLAAGVANTILVTASDAAANTATDSIIVTQVATSANPVVTICGLALSPCDGTNFTTTASEITLRGTATDDGQIDSVTYTSDRCGAGTATGVQHTTSTNWAADITLPTGACLITVTVTDRDVPAHTNTDTITITYTPGLLDIDTTSLGTNGAENTELYKWCVLAHGGTQPYSWSISAGALPSGLTISATTGCITGTPSDTPGTFNFTVRVQDSAGTPLVDTQALSLPLVAAAAGEDPHEYFNNITATFAQCVDATSSNCLLAMSGVDGNCLGTDQQCTLRAQTELNNLTSINGSNSDPRGWNYQFNGLLTAESGTEDYYDRQDGAKLRLIASSASTTGSNSLKLTYPFNVTTGKTITFGWDVYNGATNRVPACDGNQTNSDFKTYQTSGPSSTRMYEMRNSWTKGSDVCWSVGPLNMRVYSEGGVSYTGATTYHAADWGMSEVGASLGPTGSGAQARDTYRASAGQWTRNIVHIKPRVAIDSAIFDPWRTACGGDLLLCDNLTSTSGVAPATLNAVYWAVCDETRDCVWILFGVPWGPEDINDFWFEFDTSAAANTRLGDIHFYLRNLWFLYQSTSTSLDDTVDLLDATIFKRPVR